MNKKLGVSFLILSFSLSSANIGLADQIINAGPIVVQPYTVQELNQEILDRDRKNRDEEISIRDLIEQNNKLIQDTLSRQQNEGLAKIDQTMLQYRNALYARDQARIAANSQAAASGQTWSGSRYGDLVALTEDADAMTESRALQNKSAMLAQKYQMLSDLRDQMADLNDRLNEKAAAQGSEKDKIIARYKQIAEEQEGKVKLLAEKLIEMDQKLSRFDILIAQKDRQIARLREDLAAAKDESSSKDYAIQKQQTQIAILQQQSPSNQGAIYTGLEHQIFTLKTTVKRQSNALRAKDRLLKQQEDQIMVLQQDSNTPMPPVVQNGVKYAGLQRQITALRERIKEEEDRIASLRLHQQPEEQISALRDKVREQDLDLKAKDDSIRWLNQVLAAAKDKAEYYRLTSQKDMISVQHVQNQVQYIKDSFAWQFKNYDQMEKDIMALRAQAIRLGQQLTQRQQQVDLLKSELEDKINQLTQAQQQVANQAQQVQQQARQIQDQQQQLQNQEVLKVQIQQKQTLIDEKEGQVTKLKAEIDTVLKDQSTLEDLFKLARQLISVQHESEGLTSEKDTLRVDENALFERQARDIEQKLRALIGAHRYEIEQLKNHAQQLQDELDQKQQRIEQLSRLVNDLRVEQNRRGVFEYQIDQLRTKVRIEEARIGYLTSELQTRQIKEINTLKDQLAQQQGAQDQVRTLQQQLADEQSSADTFKTQLAQKQDAIDRLDQQLRERIAGAKAQSVVEYQMHELRTQLAAQEDRISYLTTQLAQQGDVSSLKATLADEQEKEETLKQQLSEKSAQYDQLSVLVSDYQKKLEDKNSAYNLQLKEMLSVQGNQTQTHDQVAQLSLQVQEEQATVVKLKKELYDLQQARSNNSDAKLDEYEEKINGLQAANEAQVQVIKDLKTELAMARDQLNGVPSKDEMDYLKTGMQKATDDLKQKDQELNAAQANANDYSKQLKDQSTQSQDLKTQLQDAYDQLNRRNEDLKYKKLEVVRLKEREVVKEGGLEDQLKVLTRQLKAAQKGQSIAANPQEVESLKGQLEQANAQIKDLQDQVNRLTPVTAAPSESEDNGEPGDQLKAALEKIDQQDKIIQDLDHKLQRNTPNNDVANLQTQLSIANERIKNLEAHVKELNASSKGDRLAEKLKQALDEIDEQGRVVNLLVQKLHELGQSVDLSQYFAKP